MILIKSYCYSTHELPFVIAQLSEGFDFIDKLVLYEYNYTHAGNKKEYEMEKVLHLIPEHLKTKLDYKKVDLSSYIVTTTDSKQMHSINEPIQRSMLFNDSSYSLSDDTIIIDVDIDEIIYKRCYIPLIQELRQRNQPLSIRLNQFFYKHNYLWKDCNFSSPTIYSYDMVKNMNYTIRGIKIQNLRDLPTKTSTVHGCHMSWVMPTLFMLKKLTSYAHPEYMRFADIDVLNRAIEDKKYPFSPSTPFTIEELSIDDDKIPGSMRENNIFGYINDYDNILGRQL